MVNPGSLVPEKLGDRVRERERKKRQQFLAEREKCSVIRIVTLFKHFRSN